MSFPIGGPLERVLADGLTVFEILTFKANQEAKLSLGWIADRTASQHLWGSRDVVGHVTIR